jgi:hypothetical protein
VNRTEPVEVSSSFRARIAEDNAMDVELYAFARQLVEDGNHSRRSADERLTKRPVTPSSSGSG